MKKKGAIFSGLIGLLAIVGLLAVFVKNSSPYVTIAEAKTIGGDGLHVAGDIQKDTLVNDLRRNQIRFSIKDAEGQALNVIYTGPPMSNLSSASKVVVIGKMEGAEFHSTQMLVKCPSRYVAAKPNL